MANYAARGVLLQIETATPGTYQTIAQVRTHSIALTRNEIDVSNHDTANGYSQFVGGLASGEVPFDFNYDANNATHNTTARGLTWAYNNGVSYNWRILMDPLPGDPAILFAGPMLNLSIAFDSAGAIAGSGRVRLDGAPTLP